MKLAIAAVRAHIPRATYSMVEVIKPYWKRGHQKGPTRKAVPS
jgi:hypothetical protein